MDGMNIVGDLFTSKCFCVVNLRVMKQAYQFIAVHGRNEARKIFL